MIADFSDQEIIDKIQKANTWVKIDSIYRLRSGQILKVKFTATEMANKAIRDGINVLYQKINPTYIEKETFIKLAPCFYCFRYDHKTQNCTKPKQTLCSFCASKDHNHNNCKANSPKCLNCGGNHKTLAASCPVRKDLIKNRAKESRDRSRSR